MFQPLVFDTIDLIEVPVTITGKRFVLREATAEAAAQFRSAAARCARMQTVDGTAQMTGIEGIGSIEPLLVSLCLCEVSDDGFRKPVPLSTVNCWPAKIIKPMFDLAKQLSDLDEIDTVGKLEKQIEALQAKLEKLKVDPKK